MGISFADEWTKIQFDQMVATVMSLFLTPNQLCQPAGDGKWTVMRSNSFQYFSLCTMSEQQTLPSIEPCAGLKN